MTGRLAKRYARALLDLAREDGTPEAIGEDLNRAVGAFEEPLLRPLLLSPVIDADARLRTAKAVAAALGLSKTVENLLGLLAERDRLVILLEIARWYEALLDERLGRARAVIRSAVPLSAAERNELTALARHVSGGREVLTTTEVDPELLGGAVLDVRGTVYDGSVKAQLARLMKNMEEGGA